MDVEDDPSGSMFLIGLFIPILTGMAMLFFLMNTRADFESHGSVYTPTLTSSVELDNTTYDVYEAIMTNGFSDHYPPECEDICWELVVSVYTPHQYGHVEGAIWGDSSGPSSDSFDSQFENENEWYKMDQRHCDGDVSELDCDEGVFIKINTDGTLHIATNYGEVEYIAYTYTSSDYERNVFIRELILSHWPLLIVAGLLLTIKYGDKPFAKGVMVGGSICVALPGFVFLHAILSGGLA